MSPGSDVSLKLLNLSIIIYSRTKKTSLNFCCTGLENADFEDEDIF